MYALCVSGAVNTQGFVWKFFMRYYTFSFILHSVKFLLLSSSSSLQSPTFRLRQHKTKQKIV